MSNDNLPAAIKLQNDAKAQVERTDQPNTGGNVRELVVNSLAEAEIKRRTEVLKDALNKRGKLEGEIRKVKPSLSLGVDPDTGKEVKRFTKKEADDRKKLVEKLDNLDAAIAKVLDEPSGETYGKVKDLAGKV